MNRLPLFTGSFLLFGIACYSQPVIENGGVVHAASYGSEIGQGSMFVIFGRGMGPNQLVQAGAIPLATTLAGTSVKVTSRGRTWDAPIVYTSATQVSAVLPSGVDTGVASISVASNGRISAASEIRIVKSAFGAFTTDSRGSGQAVIQNFLSSADQPQNGGARPARSGQTVTLWGTGLGPITGRDDSPAGGITFPDVRVFVGGIEATVTYSGRSGCCVAVDQLVFRVPERVDGCNLPVEVRVAGAASPQRITMAATPGGSAGCNQTSSRTYFLGPITLQADDAWRVSRIADRFAAALGESCRSCIIPPETLRFDAVDGSSAALIRYEPRPENECLHRMAHNGSVAVLRPKEVNAWGEEQTIDQGRY